MIIMEKLILFEKVVILMLLNVPSLISVGKSGLKKTLIVGPDLERVVAPLLEINFVYR